MLFSVSLLRSTGTLLTLIMVMFMFDLIFFNYFVLKQLTLIARQTFDLFGHLWTCVLVNFVTILVVIIGIFGGHQRRPAYVLLYLTWQLLTIAWNAFLVCFYLEIGPYTLTNGGDFNLINLGTGSRSWFEANGHGCNASYNISDLSDYLQLIRPVEVIGCYVDYRIVECVQAGLQMLLSINSTCISFFLIYAFSHQKPSPDAVCKYTLFSSFSCPDSFAWLFRLTHFDCHDSLTGHLLCVLLVTRSGHNQRTVSLSLQRDLEPCPQSFSQSFFFPLVRACFPLSTSTSQNTRFVLIRHAFPRFRDPTNRSCHRIARSCVSSIVSFAFTFHSQLASTCFHF